MHNSNTHRFKLDETSKKFNCPECRQKRFVKYIDTETEEYIADEVGRCDRENNCSYHLPPKEYFSDTENDFKINTTISSKIKIEEIKVIDYIPFELVELSMELNRKTNFARYVKSLFEKEICDKQLSKYFVGSSSNYDDGKACIFWRIDRDINVRTGKIMSYDNVSGKRDKQKTPTWAHNNFKKFNYQLCFFGEHLLTEYPDKPVAIVESEKTAIIASVIMPDMIWLSTGGQSGCKWKDYEVHKVLKDRTIILFPDFGYANKQTKKTCYQAWSERAEEISKSISCRISVSRILEDSLPQSERVNDSDLVDIYVIRDRRSGYAVDMNGKLMFLNFDISRL